MKIQRSLLIGLTVLCVSIPLIYFALSPIYLIYIQIKPNQHENIQFISTEVLLKSEEKSILFFDLRASVKDSTIKKVKFRIRPALDGKWFPQDEVKVSKELIFGTIQLGHPEYSVIKTEQYTFQLLNVDDNSLLSDGQITANVEKISGSNSYLIGAIGIIASILQILSFIMLKKE